MSRHGILRASGLAALLTSSAPTVARAHVFDVGPAAEEQLVQPVLQNSATIEYPPGLLDGPEPPGGEVVVKFTVGTDGVPKELSVERGVHVTLDALAVEAVSTLRYTPGQWKGKPVEVVLRIGLTIEAPAPEPAAPPDPESSRATQKGPDEGVEYEPDEPEPNLPVRIRGQILQAGVRTAVQGASVLALPAPPGSRAGRIKKKVYEPPTAPAWEIQATTGERGEFELKGVPDGLVRLVILTQGFERLEYIEDVRPGEELSVRYYQTRMSTNPYRTVVRTNREQREEVTRRSISVEEINALPGSQGDALKSIQNFPGVARAPFGAGLLLVRGAAPDDSAVFLGYHEIPQLFHFGGLTSVFNSDILTQIDFIPGNFDSRYGDAIGGVINVSPRKGKRDGYHGYVDSDLFDTGALVEGPVGKGSFILGVRRSYIDLVLGVALPKDAGLEATIAPRYWDYQALFDYPLDGGDISVRVFGSDDRTKLVFTGETENEDDTRNRFETTVYFHRVDLAYRTKKGPWEFLVAPSYRHDFASLALGDLFRFKFTTNAFFGRAEASRWLTKRHGFRIGADIIAGQAHIDAQAPPIPTDEGGTSNEFRQSDTFVPFAWPSLYTTWTIGLGERFTLYPGTRIQLYSAPLNRTAIDPRLRAAWNVADRTTLKAGAGLYSQAPNVAEWNDTWGNPNLAPERSFHASVGIAQGFDHQIRLEVTGFAKYLWDMAEASKKLITTDDGTIGPETFANTGTGRIYGAELLLRKDLARDLFGWVSYTLMRSERKADSGEPYVLFDFDQTHILTLIAVYKLPKHWQIGARFRLVSGNPDTPVIGATYDAAGDFYIPITGSKNSDRLPMFHQLDFRIDKTWVYRRLTFTAYLDIQNVYNQQNAEFTNHSFDYREKSIIPGLPIIPSVGLKVAF